jgi:hypothetical protein
MRGARTRECDHERNDAAPAGAAIAGAATSDAATSDAATSDAATSDAATSDAAMADMAMARSARGGSRLCIAGALAIALGAGCFSDRGVVIEVDIGDTRASEVELYLGKTKCDPANNPAGIDCTAIAPPDGTVALGGTIWFRDDASPYRATVKGRTATFHLTAASKTTLPIVIAVGRSLTPLRPIAEGTATLRDVEIPVDRGRIVTVALAAAQPVVARPIDAKNLTEDRVREWPKTAPESSCVVVEHWNNGQAERDFIVPAEDPDCDDVQKPECNPAAFHGAGIVGGAPIKPDCVVENTERCVIGNGCSDDHPGEITECAALPRELCVPSALCANCSSLAGDCIRDTIAGDPVIPRVVCEVPTTAALDMCGGENSAVIDLTTVPEYFGRGCGRQPLLASLQANGFSTRASFGGATFELSGAGDQCTFTVTWKSGSPRVGTDHGFVVLETRNGGVLLPIAFQFLSEPPTCTLPMKCIVLSAPDTMWSCVQ